VAKQGLFERAEPDFEETPEPEEHPSVVVSTLTTFRMQFRDFQDITLSGIQLDEVIVPGFPRIGGYWVEIRCMTEDLHPENPPRQSVDVIRHNFDGTLEVRGSFLVAIEGVIELTFHCFSLLLTPYWLLNKD
jgi:hypothetical protein